MKRSLYSLAIVAFASTAFGQSTDSLRRSALDALRDARRFSESLFGTTTTCGGDIVKSISQGKEINSKLLDSVSPECRKQIADNKMTRAELRKTGSSFLTAVYGHPNVKELERLVKERGERAVNDQYKIKASQQTATSVVVSGAFTDPNAAVFIYVSKLGHGLDSESAPTAVVIPGDKSAWAKRIYFRLGAGGYVIQVFSVDNYKAQHMSFYVRPIGQLTLQAPQAPNSISSDLLPSPSAQSDHSQMKVLAESITKTAKSKREAALMIHEWISQNVKYDDELLNVIIARGRPLDRPISAVSALNLRKGVCSDIAIAEVALLRSIGIPARYVTGISNAVAPEVSAGRWASRENHAWAQAYIDNNWIHLDPTFEAASPGLQYFDTDDARFADDHSAARIHRSM